MATSKGGYVSGGFDILKAPNAPTITSVTTGIGSATVAFTAPADVGGGAITSYTITAVNESTGDSTGATGSASPITISPGGGTFKIRAAATNIYGPGRVSQYETGKQLYSGLSLWEWGANSSGQLGQNNTVYTSSPVQVGSLTTWSQVSASSKGLNYPATLAIRSDGTMWAWGSGGIVNDKRGLNDGNVPTLPLSSPVQVGVATDWKQVSTSEQFSFAVKTTGTLWGAGRAQYGQLAGLSSTNVFLQVGALTNWDRVSAGKFNGAAVKTDGTLWTWGYNSFGEVGDGTRTQRNSPVQVGALTNWKQVDAGEQSPVAVKTDGTIWAWGRNTMGQLGQGNTISRSSPVQIGTLTNWASVSCGNYNVAAVKTDGTLWTWGFNSNGVLGDGTTVYKSSPVQVGSLTNWKEAALWRAAIAVKTDGTLWGWGRNASGAIGDGTTVNRSSPVQVGSLSSWYGVSAGVYFTSALYGVV